ncbi:drebrin-like protein B isoform X2 [Ciona intestinalis]
MSVNFFKHNAKLVEAYKDVLNDKTDTDWALFTYEGNQNDLKVQETGDEGLEELESEFNSGKIMYAFVRVKDPNTKMIKFILIVWQGEGVPATRKGACANHVKDINRFFKGSHMTLYCRNDDEGSADEIMKQVTKTTSNFTFVAPKEDSNIPAPVSSVYKRINPEREILASKDDKFWVRMQAEEDARKQDEKKRLIDLRKKEAVEIKEREQKSEEARNRLVKQREQEISEKMKAQKIADNLGDVRQKEKKAWEQQEKEQEESLRELRQMRRTQSIEHAQEAEVLTTKRGNNPRAMWEQREKEANAPPPVRKYSSSGSRTSSISEQPEPATNYEPPPKPAHQEPEPVHYEPEPVHYEPEPVHYEPEPVHYEPEPEPQPEPYESVPQPTAYEPEPAYQSAEPVEDQIYSEPPAEPSVPEPSYQPDNQYETDQQQYDNQQQYEEQQPYEDQHVDTGHYSEVSGQYQESAQCSAEAMYDYQAADDTEISFDPGDVITDIEQIDEGWWRGTAPNGSNGLFPANYVTLL